MKLNKLFNNGRENNVLDKLEANIKYSIKEFITAEKQCKGIRPYDELELMGRAQVHDFMERLYDFICNRVSQEELTILEEKKYQVTNIILDILSNDRMKLNIYCGQRPYTSYETSKCLVFSSSLKKEVIRVKNKMKAEGIINDGAILYDNDSSDYGLYVERHNIPNLIKKKINYKNVVKFIDLLQ